ncbi:MAG: PASTA domain-containing protein [Clostridia bacterium]
MAVDDPETNLASNQLGREVVAPIFKAVMEQSLRYFQQTPDMSELEKKTVAKVDAKKAASAPVKINEVAVPQLVGMSASTGAIKAKQAGLVPKTIGTGTKIVQQFPTEQEKLATGSEVMIVTDRLTNVKMPDFTGKSLREVMEFTSLLKMTVTFTGSGYVRTQSIPPGTALSGKEKVMVTLLPAPSVKE